MGLVVLLLSACALGAHAKAPAPVTTPLCECQRKAMCHYETVIPQLKAQLVRRRGVFLPRCAVGNEGLGRAQCLPVLLFVEVVPP